MPYRPDLAAEMMAGWRYNDQDNLSPGITLRAVSDSAPYAWILQDRESEERLRLTCLRCGDSDTLAGVPKGGGRYRFPRFLEFYRTHKTCKETLHTHAEDSLSDEGDAHS